ncbi:MAG TPA: NADP-dependent oxidoreductase [Acidimicrobiia bacterium]|jgi:NADPH:quinone reductase-like Zn-dependent oxidoreductase|nr:NADP-dependent oxidoreductase [Acidimicrobiia bacterium]
MKAIATTEFGAPATLVEIPAPEPAEGEILARVASSSINGFDLSVASGRLKGMMEHRFPVVLGKDFAGTVEAEATGHGVDGFAEGDAVFGVVMKRELGEGSFGERVATPAAFAAKVPDGVDAATAGALGLAGTAAHDAVEAVEPQHGEIVLVSGATGGVGVIAVQLLKARGAHVIATASTDDEIAFVREHGADDIVDYRGDLAAAVREKYPRGVDALLHFAGDGAQLAGLLAPGGRLASTLGLSAEQLGRDDLTLAPIMANPSRPRSRSSPMRLPPTSSASRSRGRTTLRTSLGGSPTSPPAPSESSPSESTTDAQPTRLRGLLTGAIGGRILAGSIATAGRANASR